MSDKKGFCCLAIQIFGAGLFAAVVTGAVIGAADVFYAHEEEQGRGYKVDIAATPPAVPANATGASGAASKDDKPVDIKPYLAKADLKLGEALIKRCQACHSFEKGQPNGVGPNQYNLVGRKVAAVPGFSYSDAMKAKGGSWDVQSISDFITAPQAVVQGTKMGFAGLKRPEERAALIAYINKHYSDNPLPLPEK